MISRKLLSRLNLALFFSLMGSALPANATPLYCRTAGGHVQFAVQPISTLVGVAIPYQVTVYLCKNGIVDTASSELVTLTLSQNPGNSMISGLGSYSMYATNGVAVFKSLILGKIGIGYILQATSLPSNAFDVSQAFNVTTIGSDTGDQLAVYQGDYTKLGDAHAVARGLAQYDVVVLSHVAAVSVSNWVNGVGDCFDYVYGDMPTMLSDLRTLHPGIKIFGYVAGTADSPRYFPGIVSPAPAPQNQDCGNWLPGLTGENAQWSCPSAGCQNFKKWVGFWLGVQSVPLNIYIDGIMIDLFASPYITPQTRDTLISYVKSQGRNVMLNTPESNNNVQFALDSPSIGAGDYVLVEGYYYAAGAYEGNAGYYADSEMLDSYRNVLASKAGIHMAALVTEGWGATISCTAPDAKYAYAEFRAHYQPGDALAYTASDLGTDKPGLNYCDHGLFH